MSAQATWLGVSERGSVFGIRTLVLLVTFFGRRAGRAVLYAITLYFMVFHRSIRRASRDYLTRVGQPSGFRASYRHVLRFAQCALDRVFFLRGRAALFDIRLEGHDLIVEAARHGRGSILLGAHLGSFESMRLAAAMHDVPIHVIMNSANTRMYNAVISSLDPDGNVKIVDVGGGRGMDVALRLRECIDRGELVAVMGDRAGPDDRATTASFLGVPARFPTGAYYLAATLRCPVYLTFGLYRGGNRYDLYCERFADPVILPRGRRDGAADEYARRYAERLAHYCRKAPDNWFNFFDFWSEP